MSEISIHGIPISFPFEPYDVQRAYMEKVIECLKNGHNGVLESPTGTGKTLSLLCSSLGWLLVKKAQIQAGIQTAGIQPSGFSNFLDNSLKSAVGKNNKGEAPVGWGLPKIIYASRTHSQLSQAMQELKSTNYRHVKAAILGSRDQMCIHPEVSKETNNTNKIHMCQAKVKSRTCFYFNNVDSKKEDLSVRDNTILDIEDLVKTGKKLSCCPYYLAKELKQSADIIFMPYNYLLDPKARKANGVELANNVIILDEAHNIERMCEESASLQIKSTDIALCIDEVTHVMKKVVENSDEGADFGSNSDSQPKDFTPDDLCALKSILLSLENAIDEIQVTSDSSVTFEGSYIFNILTKAQINDNNSGMVTTLVENLIQYLSLSDSASPFQRKGSGLQKFADLLNIIYSNNHQMLKRRITECYKVHVHIEDKKNKKSDSWSVIKGPSNKSSEKVISYWCFSPGFGMKQLLDQQVRCIILTSGTLAPLKPLISELGISINVTLENPHIVKSDQIFVKIIGQGPDGQILNSNYENRENPKYIASLGRTILSFSRVVPDGLLIFFPSYPILSKCQQAWQLSGLWSNISEIKPIFVEPQRKDTFNSIISEFYNKINDVTTRGAIFMAVCRGKVSEGLDFADMNGRAVIITGLPFPPYMDPRIVLKKKYLEELKKKDKEYLSGDEWYSLEASRAVNQAIGRVIRHKNDYGAILLCDTRFGNIRLKSQLSSWLKNYCTTSVKFGESVSELCKFFKNAEKLLPSPKLKPHKEYNDNGYSYTEHGACKSITATRSVPKKTPSKSNLEKIPQSNEVLSDIFYYKNSKDFSSKSDAPKKASDLFSILDMNPELNTSAQSVNIKRDRSDDIVEIKSIKKKYKLVPCNFNTSNSDNAKTVKKTAPENLVDFVKCVKSSLDKDAYKSFQLAISSYKNKSEYKELISTLDKIFFPDENLHYLIKGMERFLKEKDKSDFRIYCSNLNL